MRSDAAVIPAWAYGTNCYAEVYYTLGAVEYSLKVLDGSDVEITSSGGVATDTNAFAALSGESAIAYRTFICPSSGSVKLSLETSGAAAEINIDRAYIGQNFRMSEALDSTIYSAYVTDGAVTTTVSNESQNFIEGNCTNPSGGVYVCTFVSGIFNSVTPNCVATGEDQQQTRITASSASSITVNQLNGGGTASDGDFRVLCQRGADSSIRKVYTPPASTELTNSFSALVTDGSATTTVSNENVDFISGNCTNGSGGVYVCTFVSGIFNSVTPNCVATGEDQQQTRITASSASSITVNQLNGAGTASDGDFRVLCQRGAGDYSVKQSTAPLLVNSVVNPSAGVTQIVSARITNSGTPTITSQDGSWISSLTDNAVGDTSVNIASGTFSSAPRCFLASSNNCGRLLYFSTDPSTSLARVITANPDSPYGASDVNFDIMCIGAK